MRFASLLLAVSLVVGCGTDDPAPTDAPDAAVVADDAAGAAADAPRDEAPDEPTLGDVEYRLVSAAGDASGCTLDVEPVAGGAPLTVPADPAICEAFGSAGLAGRRARLTTEATSVPAASCDGDPDCPDREEVDLVVNFELFE